MALADITLNDGASTPAAHVFAYTGTVDGRVIRSVFAAPAEEPELLTIAHTTAKKNGVTEKRHLLRFDITVLDDDGVTPYTGNIRVMADIPNTIYSDDLAKNLGAFVRNYMSEANSIAWMKGSVG